jgi:hypothetical protein
MREKSIAATFALLATVSARGEDVRPIADWSPPRSELVMEAKGDLDRDGVDDLARIFRAVDPEKVLASEGLGFAEIDTNPRTVVVLAGGGDGYRRVVESARFVPPAGDPGQPCREDPLQGMAIERGVLKLTFHEWWSCGGGYVVTTRYAFRHDGKGLRLIGEDESSFHRATGEKQEVSINWLTGRRKTTTGLNEFEPATPEVAWDTVPKSPRYLEQLEALADE